VRKSCHKDRRVTYVHLTKKGEELIEKIFPTHSDYVNQLFSTLSDDEKETMIALCKKISLQKGMIQDDHYL
ncbi:MAG TPA: hypothetical protein VLA13_01875, partial [Massilibacterium sp.]|nr:hypothetical protein [Massilibacterium sp.]